MRKVTFVLMGLLAQLTAAAQDTTATANTTANEQPAIWTALRNNPKAISVKYDQGQMLKTNDFLKMDGRDLDYRAMAVKFGLGLAKNDWRREIYHQPYTGAGFYIADFDESHYFGNPMSLFFFHGGSLARLGRHCNLQYEWNLGYSFNWSHYDPIEAPDNITIGSRENAHVGFNLFLEWQLARNFDLKIGGGVTHFSNGATHVPNKGANLWSPMIELAYRWDDPDYEWQKERIDTAELHKLYPELKYRPEHEKHIKHEIQLTVSKRQLYMDTIGSGLPNEYYDHTFRVFQLSYAPLYSPSYKFAYGPSLDVVYDESNNARVVAETGADGIRYNHLHLASLWDRMQIGLSAKGEMRTPYFTYFGQLGFDLQHAVEKTARFYQIVGVQTYFNKHLYGTCGIRAIRLSKAQFIFWSLGYTLDGKTPWGKKQTDKNTHEL